MRLKCDCFGAERSVRFAAVREVPEDLPILLGDGVHNLYCALDHVVWAIVPESRKARPRDAERIGFPICRREPADWPELLKEKAPCVTEAQGTILKRHQPFTDCNHPLVHLRSLEIQDKHRAIQVMVLCLENPVHPKTFSIDLRTMRPVSFELVETGPVVVRNGVEVARLRTPYIFGEQNEVEADFYPSKCKLSFRDGVRVTDQLRSIVCEVEQIVDEIDADLAG